MTSILQVSVQTTASGTTLSKTVAQGILSYDGSWGSSLGKTSDGKKDKISVYAFSTSDSVQDTDEKRVQIYF